MTRKKLTVEILDLRNKKPGGSRTYVNVWRCHLVMNAESGSVAGPVIDGTDLRSLFITNSTGSTVNSKVVTIGGAYDVDGSPIYIDHLLSSSGNGVGSAANAVLILERITETPD